MHCAVVHSKECQLWQFLLYAHLINVLSLAAVNHIIQTPVPAPLNELCTVDVFLNVSPISTLDPPTPMSRNAQQDPTSEPIDIEVPLPLQPLREVHLPATRVPETMLDLSSQAEVEAITNSTHPGGLSSMGPVPKGVTLASTDACHHSKQELVQIDHGPGGWLQGTFVVGNALRLSHTAPGEVGWDVAGGLCQKWRHRENRHGLVFAVNWASKHKCGHPNPSSLTTLSHQPVP